MKTLKKIILFTILTASFTFISCQQQSSEPVITEKTITDKTDPDFPKKMDGSEYPDGTQIEYKKVETDDYTTIDETITCTDGTEVVVHILKEMEITTTEQTTTFPETGNQNDPKTETVKEEKGVKPGKGNVEDRTTTTEYGNGKKITETYLTEGLSSKLATSKETINPDGSSEKETYSTENVDDFTNTKVPYAINKSNFTKDKNGNITQDVVISIEAQDSEGNLPVTTTTTTTNYSGSIITGSVVETKYQNGPNCGFFLKEVKDSSGKTTAKEMEYYFDNGQSYYGYDDQGNQDYNTRIDRNTVKIIFKDDGTNKKYKITQGAGDIPEATYHHNVMCGRWQYVTVLKVETNKITIVSIGGHEDFKEGRYPVVDGTSLNEEYTLDNNLTLSFDSQF